MDTYRFDTDESDLREAVSLYNLYRNNKDNKHALSAVKSDPRAKLICISSFVEKLKIMGKSRQKTGVLKHFGAMKKKKALE